MKILFIAAGFLFMGLGVVGVFFPILPTVPFLLLASVCFAKGSDRVDRWFKSTKLYKNNLEEFQKNGSMTMKTKLCILIPVSAMLLLAFFMMHNIPGRIVIAVLIVLKYYFFIFRIKTIK
ncbi:MAG: YbaN family protein [Clostridiales bacterium]|nr:YbaN family protein [Clostridiales bacterium]